MEESMRKFSWYIGTMFVLTMMVLPLHAQSGRGTLTGVVKDPQGALVPGAEISATNKANGAESKAISTSAGLYRFPYLEPGNYSVTAGLKGFKTAARDNVTVLLAQTVTLDFTLEVGEIAQTVEVSGETPLLETSTGEIGTNATERDVHSWPIFVGDGTRQIQTFIFSALPGTQGSTFEGTINGGQLYSHEILIDGITIGRMDLNGGSNNEFTPTLDAVSEFKLQTGALSSQYGNTQTALTNFGLKGGTNDIHGTLFWFNDSKRLNAATWACKAFPAPDGTCTKATTVLNNFGATAGGAIKKDKTHWFFSYEGNRLSDWGTSGFDNLPIGAFKQGDLSALLDPNFTKDPRSGTVVGKDALGRNVVFGQIYNPASTRQLPDGTWIRDPFPGNIIPSDQISRVTKNVLQNDLPNPQLDQLLRNNPRVGTCCPVGPKINNYEAKIDEIINDKHKVSGAFIYNGRVRLRYEAGPQVPGVPIPGPAMSGDKTQATPGYIIRLSEDWTISATKLNHMGLGYNRFMNSNVPNAQSSGIDWASVLGMQNVGSHSFPNIQFTGQNSTLSGNYRQYGASPGSVAPNGSTVALDDFTWIKGAHSVRFGGEIRRYYLNEGNPEGTGTYYFDNEQTAQLGADPATDTAWLNSTGFAYAAFLLGATQHTALQIPTLTHGNRSQTVAFYVQDDWKFNSKLTLNLGVRWDIPTPFHEVLSRMSGLDPTMPNPGAGGYPGAFVVLGDGPGRSGQTNFSGTYYKQFAPRFGFAYAATQKMVLRGGFGINYSPPIMDGWNYGDFYLGFDGSNPLIRKTLPYTGVSAYNWDSPYPVFNGALPSTDPTLQNGSNIAYYAPNLNIGPLVQNWNFGIQYELPWQTVLQTNYIGNHGAHLSNAKYVYSLNQVPSQYLSLGNVLLDDISLHPQYLPYAGFTGTVGQALRPFPQYQTVDTFRSNVDWSNYNSLQVTLTKRATHGLSFLVSYTFSKILSTSDTAGPGAYGYHTQDYYNRKADYSVSQYNHPQDLKVTWIYDLPFGQKGRWLRSGAANYALGGWRVAAIQRYESGSPLTLGQGGFEGNALYNPGLRPNIVLPPDQWILPGGKPNNPDPILGTPYLNPAAFAQVPTTDLNVPLGFGNSPRYFSNLRGFATHGEDMSLVKQTNLPFREGMFLELRLDITNLFNRINLCDPNTDVTNVTQFGRVVGKCGGPRTMQWGARFTF
jgi:hypothetical protein